MTRKSLNFDLMASAQSTIEKPNFDNFGKILQIISCKTFQRKMEFAKVLLFCLQPFVQDCMFRLFYLFFFFLNKIFFDRAKSLTILHKSNNTGIKI